MATVEAKVKEEASFEATVRVIGIKGKRELLGMLTTEQKNKWKALWEQRRNQYRSHMRAETDEGGAEGAAKRAGLDLSEAEADELADTPSAG